MKAHCVTLGSRPPLDAQVPTSSVTMAAAFAALSQPASASPSSSTTSPLAPRDRDTLEAPEGASCSLSSAQAPSAGAEEELVLRT
ncbi:hypothetical protein EYR36_000249 [Pleurotus pulmonarius]|nr:hypothetical protein EYR36_000249 [Pleurotus pulmonarius]